MFTFIEPTYDSFSKSSTHSFLEKIKNNSALSHFFQDPQQGHFILTEDPTNGILGGAFLLKQKIISLHKDIRKSLPSFTSHNHEVWTCLIALYFENNHLSAHFELFCKTFYQNLYRELVQFGLRYKINFLCMSLEPGEYLCTEAIGFWPYVVEVRPQDSLDGLFHGVLSLSKSHGLLTSLPGEALCSQSTKLAA